MTNSIQNKFKQMTEEPVKSLVIKMALPTVFSMLVTAFYNMADTYFVGGVGTSATGAVGVVFSVMAIIQAVGFFFGHGSGNFISRKLGAQRIKEAGDMATTGFISTLIVGIIMAVFGLIFRVQLAQFLGSTPTILPYAVDYLIYILIGTPFIMGSFVLNNQLRFQGNAFYGMIGMSIGAVINVALDPLFIIFFNMGVAGAGLATLISQITSFIILIVMNRKKSAVPISLKKFKPSMALYKEVIRGGFPSLCRQGLGSLAVICLNHKAGIHGDEAIAAMSIVNRISMFAMSAVIGIGQGFQPVCGFNYGAKKYKRVKDAFWFTTFISLAILGVEAIVGYLFAPQIITLFRKDDPAVIDIGTVALRYQCFAIILMGFSTPANMMVQTMGKAIKATFLSMGRQFLFYLPALFVLEPLLGLTGIQLTQPVADIFAFAMTIPIVISVLRELKE